jgi:hypothetical protein
MADKNERRRVLRRHLLYYGRVYDETAQEFLGYLVDITDHGFQLLSEKAYPLEQERRFKVEITEDLDPHPYINFTAKSIWSEPDIDPHHFNIGFEISQIKPGDKEIIQKIVKSYGFRDN